MTPRTVLVLLGLVFAGCDRSRPQDPQCGGLPAPDNCEIVLPQGPDPDNCYGGMQSCWCIAEQQRWTSTHCDPPAPIDAAPVDGSRLDVGMGPYLQACTTEPDTCPAPYVCTPADIEALEPADRCLVPCTVASDCSYHFSCCCRGVDCESEVGADGLCVCI